MRANLRRILTLPQRRIEVCADPTGPSRSPGYRQHADWAVGTEVPPVIDGRPAGGIAVAKLALGSP